jgi:hypothetical protein
LVLAISSGLRLAFEDDPRATGLAVLHRAAVLVLDVRRTQSTYEKVSSASFAGRECSTARQATSFIALRVRWSIDRNNMIFRLAARTAEEDRR